VDVASLDTAETAKDIRVSRTVHVSVYYIVRRVDGQQSGLYRPAVYS